MTQQGSGEDRVTVPCRLRPAATAGFMCGDPFEDHVGGMHLCQPCIVAVLDASEGMDVFEDDGKDGAT